MGGKVARGYTASKPRSSTSKQDSKQNADVKQAANKKHKRWSKDRSERAREACDRDTDLLYNVLKKQSTVPIPTPTSPKLDSVLTLTECIQKLGR
ncbi:hypothetical protein BS17DRAFT_880955 [Gyrodon lividus]|nr:hypothetical protein BS17DRAFT_880955 [Gyrodon lividus]